MTDFNLMVYENIEAQRRTLMEMLAREQQEYRRRVTPIVKMLIALDPIDKEKAPDLSTRG